MYIFKIYIYIYIILKFYKFSTRTFFLSYTRKLKIEVTYFFVLLKFDFCLRFLSLPYTYIIEVTPFSLTNP